MACKRSGVRIPIAPPRSEAYFERLTGKRPACEGHSEGQDQSWPTGTHAHRCGDTGEGAAGTASECLPARESLGQRLTTSARWPGRSEQAGICQILKWRRRGCYRGDVGRIGDGACGGGRMGGAPRSRPTARFKCSSPCAVSVPSATIRSVSDLLAGVNDIRWRELGHAYGTAEDVPVLLHTVASDPAGADRAIGELFGCICHQGSVYSATPYAVRFVARIAAAGIHTVALLGLLGCIADSDDERGLEVAGAARAAVTGQIGVLTPLLADLDAEVRAVTAWALAKCRAPAELVGPLRRCWDGETHSAVRAAVLKALTALDPSAAAGVAADVLAGSGAASLRLIAATAFAAAGMDWSDRLHEAATAWMAGVDLLSGFFEGDRDPFADLVIALAARGDPGASLRLVVTGPTGPVGLPCVFRTGNPGLIPAAAC